MTELLKADVRAHHEVIEAEGRKPPRDFREALAWLQRPLFLGTARYREQLDMLDRERCSALTSAFVDRLVKEGKRHGVPLYVLEHDREGEDLKVAVLHGTSDERLPAGCWDVVAHFIELARRRSLVELREDGAGQHPCFRTIIGGAVTCNDFKGLRTVEALRRIRRLGRARV